jgi:hypothetical protein
MPSPQWSQILLVCPDCYSRLHMATAEGHYPHTGRCDQCGRGVVRLSRTEYEWGESGLIPMGDYVVPPLPRGLGAPSKDEPDQ